MVLIFLIVFILIIAGIVAISNKNEEYKKNKFGAERYEQMRENARYKTMDSIRMHDECKEYKKQKRSARKNAIVGAIITDELINRR